MKSCFDIIVPTYNRYKELPEFFEKNSSIKDEQCNLWIIDDASVQKDLSVFPSWNNLKLIELKKNKGQAFARNVAIDKSDCDIIISLDDDAWFENLKLALGKVRQLFDNYKDVGCIMFNIATPLTEYSVMETGTVLPLHVTCGCAYRRETLEEVGGYSGFLHSGAEETGISMRIYRAGWKIIFAKDIRVFHNFSPGNRSVEWYLKLRFNTTRNDLLNVVMYYPPLLIIPFLAGKYFSQLRYAVSNKVAVGRTVIVTLISFFGFIQLLPQAIRNRKGLSVRQLLDWRSLFKKTS